jgi:FMN phosphatase YigB (HAD superfamily)
MANSQNIPHFFLDLDRTLFDTDRAKPIIYEAIQEAYDIDADALRFDRRRHYVYPSGDDTYYYPLFAHLHKDHAIDPDEAAGKLGDALEGHDFLFEDAHLFLDELDAAEAPASILTFGDDAYQEFKVSLCPRLSDYDVTVTRESKGLHIATTTEAPSVMIDDKRIHSLAHATGLLKPF